MRDRQERYASKLPPDSPRPYEPPPRVLPDESLLNQIVRYEAHLDRRLRTALHELEALQARRRGDASPLARLDISRTDEE
jgi:hypothetical protein